MTGNSKAKMSPLKGSWSLPAVLFKAQGNAGWPRTQGKSETRVSDDPPTLSCTHTLIHPTTYLPIYTHSSIHLPSHMGLPTLLFPSHFPICSSIHLPTLLPIYPFTHPVTDIQFKNSFTIHPSPIPSPTHQANTYLLSNYEPSPISNNIPVYPPYSH